MKSFYEILQVDKNADEKQIKKQYSILIRQYSPEKSPEKYREIREAYDVLKDAKSRENYNVSLLHGDKILELEKNGRDALDNEDYLLAINSFEAILELDSKNAIIKNLLGETLLGQNKYRKALVLFFELFEEYPNNTGYICRLGFCNEMLGDLNRAEKLYMKAYTLDENDKEPVNWLVKFYWRKKEYSKAEKFLKEDIYRDGNLDFSDFQSFYKLLETYIRMDEVGHILNVIKEMKKIIPNDEVIKRNVSWEFARLGSLLDEEEIYSYAEVFYKFSKSIMDLGEEWNIDGLINRSKAYKLVDNLFNDDNIIGEVKGPLLHYFHFDKLEQKTVDNIWKNFTDGLDIYNDEFIVLMENSIMRLKKYYYELYKEKSELYDMAIKTLLRNKKILNFAGHFINDYNIPAGLRTIIVAILDKNDNNYKLGISQLERESTLNIKRGIQYIKSTYSEFYDASSDFVDKLEMSL